MKTPYFPRAFVFDWDNTLVDSWGAIGQAMNHTRAHFGLKTWSAEEIKRHCTRAARESFPDWFGENWQKAYQVYYEGFDAARKSRDISTTEGAEQLLKWLTSHKIPAFVVSNKRGDFLRDEAKRLGWEPYFVSIIGAQDAPFDKPHRAHVDHALSFGHTTPDKDIWFVGDSEADMLCAQNSGCTPILIGDKISANNLEVEQYYQHCAQLLDYLKGLRA